MPANDPLTRLFQRMAAPPGVGRADLHIHTTASDGRYTPAQVLDVARRCGLAAIAITDHDTLAGYRQAKQLPDAGVEIIPAVELSCEFAGREVHLLAYFVDPDHPELNAALDAMQQHRVIRYAQMVERLSSFGIRLESSPDANGVSLGRRHLAEQLVAAGHCATIRQAFTRYLHDAGPANEPKQRLPIDRALAMVRSAGGVASYAHPPYTLNSTEIASLRDQGLGGLEAEYPGFANSRTQHLRDLAKSMDLAITAGSDCHGPDDRKRAIGAKTLGDAELAALRSRAYPAHTVNGRSA